MSDDVEKRVLTMSEVKKLVNFDLTHCIHKFAIQYEISTMSVDITLAGLIGASLAVQSPDLASLENNVLAFAEIIRNAASSGFKNKTLLNPSGVN